MNTIENRFKIISEIFVDGQWEYDNRFTAAAVVFKAENAKEISEKLATVYEQRFDHKTIKKGPKNIKNAAKIFYGINDGQLLLISEVDDVMIYGAWWPWGNGENITLRIGIFADNDSLSNEKIEEYLKNSFPI